MYRVIFAILVLLFTAPLQVWAGAGIAIIGESTHNFGKVFEDKVVSHIFQIKNTGDADLVIDKIYSGCSCATTQFTQKITPGGTGQITVNLDTHSYGGSTLTRDSRVFTNAQAEALDLQVSANVVTIADIDPPRVSLTGKVGENLAREVTVMPSEDYPCKIVRAYARFGKNVSVELTPHEIGTGIRYHLLVTNTRQVAGRYFDEIILVTDHADVPQLVIKVNGTILEP